MDATATSASTTNFNKRAMIVNFLITAVFDIGVAVVVFQLATAWGASTQLAYVLSGVGPLIGLAITWVRARTISGVSLILLAFLLLSSVAAFVGGADPRLLIVKDSVITGGFGLVCLLSMLFPRPLMFYFGAKFATDGTREGLAHWDSLWQYPMFRRTQYLITTLWGVGYLLEATVRIVFAYTVDFATAFTISAIIPWVFLGALMTATIVIGQRAGRRGEARRAAAEAAQAPAEPDQPQPTP